jgi:hypothetical protein
MILSKEQLSNELISRWNYAPYLVEDVVNQLFAMDEELQKAFEAYADSDQFPNDPKIFGLSPFDIARAYTFCPPAVFLQLDWIRRSPEEALESLVKDYHKPLPDEFDASALFEWKKSQTE